MKHVKIIALAPKDEHFDAETFITNEAAWITTGHLDQVEAALVQSETDAAAQQIKLDAALAAKLKVEGELATANAAITASATALDTANATIGTLKAKVVTLGKAAAGDFSKTPKPGGDVIPGEADPEAQYMTSVDLEKQKMNKLWPGAKTPA